jgi:hypothetical protein
MAYAPEKSHPQYLIFLQSVHGIIVRKNFYGAEFSLETMIVAHRVSEFSAFYEIEDSLPCYQ